jgi:hypothetical protein
MTTITFHGTDHPTSTVWTGLVASFSEFCAGARDGHEIEARARSYARMSQPDLAELGMSRADIYRAALIGRPV